MPAPLIVYGAIAAASLAYQLYSGSEERKSLQEAQAKRTAARRAELVEKMERWNQQIEDTKTEGHTFLGTQTAAAVAGGVDVSSSSISGARADTTKEVMDRIEDINHIKAWASKMVDMGIDIDLSNLDSNIRISKLRQFGSMLQTSGKFTGTAAEHLAKKPQ